MSEVVDVLVVGAGMSGLIAARALMPTCSVVVVDKGRGLGGRLATRRIGDAVFDHGAQFFTADGPAFAALVASWVSSGVAEPWFDQLPESNTAPTPVRDQPGGRVRYRGVPAMTTLAKALADGLDARRATTVTSVSVVDGQWQARLASGAAIRAGALVLSSPVPQSLALLDAGAVALAKADRSALERVAYDPCLAVLAPLDGPSGLADPGAKRFDGTTLAWLADNQLKGISPVPAVTLHGSPEFSRVHWDEPDAVIVDALLGVAGLASAAVAGETQVMRWRYAKPSVIHDRPVLLAADLPPLVFAGDGFGGPRVEGAALSGWAAAAALVAPTD